jgi:hypothetical protein
MSYSFELTEYPIGHNLCVLVNKGNERFGKLSINIPSAPELAPNEFWAKTYSENDGWAQQLLNSYFEKSGKKYQLPYDIVYSYRLPPAFIKQLFEATYNSKTDIYEASQTLFNLHERFCTDDNNSVQAN